MKHQQSPEDAAFVRAFESGEVLPADFNHAAHVRLAYTCLCGNDIDGAISTMKTALLAFLNRNGISENKYHDTLTGAWVMAVDHFMKTRAPTESAAAFMRANPELLDSKIMLTHYSAEVLFSAEARVSFVAPDIQPIPPPNG